MISRASVCAGIDEASGVFAKCWDALAAWKERLLSAETRDQFLAFQYDLGQSLYDLSRMYDAVVAESKATVRRKHKLSAKRFRSRMSTLADYARAINDTILMGKDLGDSFAWLFYIREPALVERHLQHAGNLHLPRGIGGTGEIELVRRLQILPDHIVVYHGTTTFLRIGDVSFVHLPTFTVSAIGELKTRRIDQNTAETAVHIIGDAKQLPTRMPFLRQSSTSVDASGTSLHPAQRDRLRRQVETMSKALAADEPRRRFDHAQESNILKLDLLVQRATRRKLTYVKVGDGIVAVALRLRPSKLSSRLLPRHVADPSKAIAETPQIVSQITDFGSRDNSNDYGSHSRRIHTRNDASLLVALVVGSAPAGILPGSRRLDLVQSAPSSQEALRCWI